MWLLLIRGLQIASILLGLFGGANAAQVGGNLYGSGEVAATDWIATLLPLIASVASWVGSQFLNVKITTPAISELVNAAIAYGKDRSEQNRLRLIVATISMLKEIGGLEHIQEVSASLECCRKPATPRPPEGVLS
jgi:hypothetical protein